jgi:hypothetical protein
VSRLLYLDQNYLSGIAKAKPAFRELRLPPQPDAALAYCDLVACDAFMADVIRRTRLDSRQRCQVFSGRRPDVLRLRDRLQELAPTA